MRKSSRGVTGMPSDNVAVRAPMYLGFEPNEAQMKVKAAFWSAWRDDPTVDPAKLTAAAVANLTDAPTIETWWRQDGFRQWFCNKDEWRQELEFSFALWQQKVRERLVSSVLADKDLISLGKLLAEMSNRMPKSAGPIDKKARELTDAEARDAVAKAALSMGWTPPQLVTPTKTEE